MAEHRKIARSAIAKAFPTWSKFPRITGKMIKVQLRLDGSTWRVYLPKNSWPPDPYQLHRISTIINTTFLDRVKEEVTSEELKAAGWDAIRAYKTRNVQ
jgi:hypothetical protein